MPCHTHKHWNSGLCKPFRGSGQMVVVSGVSWMWTFDDSYCFAWPACPLTCFWGSLWPRRRMSVVWRSSEWKTTTHCLLDAHNDQQTPNNQRHNQNQDQKIPKQMICLNWYLVLHMCFGWFMYFLKLLMFKPMNNLHVAMMCLSSNDEFGWSDAQCRQS